MSTYCCTDAKHPHFPERFQKKRFNEKSNVQLCSITHEYLNCEFDILRFPEFLFDLLDDWVNIFGILRSVSPCEMRSNIEYFKKNLLKCGSKLVVTQF